MQDETKMVCDIRYSINYYPNSVTAAEHAIEVLGVDRILIDVLYSPAADEDDEDCFLLPPPLTPEYDILTGYPWSAWYYEYVISRQFTVPDLLDEVFSLNRLRECWMCLKCDPEMREKAAVKLAELLPSGTGGILVSGGELPKLPEGLYGCDRSGRHRYTLISRPKSISEDAALMASSHAIRPNTFSLDCHPAAEYKTISLP